MKIKKEKLKLKVINIKRNELKKYYQLKSKETEKILYNYALNKNDNNVVMRQLQNTAYNLLNFSETSIFKKDNFILPNKLKRRCYGCNVFTNKFHYDYIFSCIKCGSKFTRYRNIYTDQTGKVAMLSGARCKIGHMTCVKLLKSGCIVIGLSRKPEKMRLLFNEYKKDENNLKWLQNLDIYPKPLDFDCYNLQEKINELYNYIDNKYGRLDILINNSAQTIRSREKEMKEPKMYEETNRYGDLKYANINFNNSWEMNIFDVDQIEMEEIYRINAIAPFIIIRTMIELMKKSKFNPFIINTHAREGIISVNKSKYHIHTNLGKSALHMLTKCLLSYNFKTEFNYKIKI
jgi:NAD(P)-dependent dehydrogenase (short-subunit alcohol dehydrogenase family)